MAVINDPGVAANISRVGEVATGATGAMHFTPKPIPWSVGHYRVTHRFAILATQAAGSRLFEIRNSGANLIIPTRMIVKILSLSAHTAIIENSLDVYKGLGFTVVDTTNTVTPVALAKRTTGMSAAPGNAQIRGDGRGRGGGYDGRHDHGPSESDRPAPLRRGASGNGSSRHTATVRESTRRLRRRERNAPVQP